MTGAGLLQLRLGVVCDCRKNFGRSSFLLEVSFTAVGGLRASKWGLGPNWATPNSGTTAAVSVGRHLFDET